MALSAKYYFVANVKFQGDDIPVYAFTPGEEYLRGWESNLAGGFSSLRETVWRADGARSFSIAVPRFYAPYFIPTISKYDKFRMWASDGKLGPYGIYNHAMTFDDVVVTSVKPIHGWKGLPAPASNLRNHFEKKIGREFYVPVAVTLASGDTTVV